MFWLDKFRVIDPTKQEQCQWFIDAFVNAVYFYEDKIILTFNYKDKAKIITTTETVITA